MSSLLKLFRGSRSRRDSNTNTNSCVGDETSAAATQQTCSASLTVETDSGSQEPPRQKTQQIRRLASLRRSLSRLGSFRKPARSAPAAAAMAAADSADAAVDGPTPRKANQRDTPAAATADGDKLDCNRAEKRLKKKLAKKAKGEQKSREAAATVNPEGQSGTEAKDKKKQKKPPFYKRFPSRSVKQGVMSDAASKSSCNESIGTKEPAAAPLILSSAGQQKVAAEASTMTLSQISRANQSQITTTGCFDTAIAFKPPPNPSPKPRIIHRQDPPGLRDSAAYSPSKPSALKTQLNYPLIPLLPKLPSPQPPPPLPRHRLKEVLDQPAYLAAVAPARCSSPPISDRLVVLDVTESDQRPHRKWPCSHANNSHIAVTRRPGSGCCRSADTSTAAVGDSVSTVSPDVDIEMEAALGAAPSKSVVLNARESEESVFANSSYARFTEAATADAALATIELVSGCIPTSITHDSDVSYRLLVPEIIMANLESAARDYAAESLVSAQLVCPSAITIDDTVPIELSDLEAMTGVPAVSFSSENEVLGVDSAISHQLSMTSSVKDIGNDRPIGDSAFDSRGKIRIGEAGDYLDKKIPLGVLAHDADALLTDTSVLDMRNEHAIAGSDIGISEHLKITSFSVESTLAPRESVRVEVVPEPQTAVALAEPDNAILFKIHSDPVDADGSHLTDGQHSTACPASSAADSVGDHFHDHVQAEYGCKFPSAGEVDDFFARTEEQPDLGGVLNTAAQMVREAAAKSGAEDQNEMLKAGPASGVEIRDFEEMADITIEDFMPLARGWKDADMTAVLEPKENAEAVEEKQTDITGKEATDVEEIGQVDSEEEYETDSDVDIATGAKTGAAESASANDTAADLVHTEAVANPNIEFEDTDSCAAYSRSAHPTEEGSAGQVDTGPTSLTLDSHTGGDGRASRIIEVEEEQEQDIVVVEEVLQTDNLTVESNQLSAIGDWNPDLTTHQQYQPNPQRVHNWQQVCLSSTVSDSSSSSSLTSSMSSLASVSPVATDDVATEEEEEEEAERAADRLRVWNPQDFSPATERALNPPAGPKDSMYDAAIGDLKAAPNAALVNKSSEAAEEQAHENVEGAVTASAQLEVAVAPDTVRKLLVSINAFDNRASLDDIRVRFAESAPVLTDQQPPPPELRQLQAQPQVHSTDPMQTEDDSCVVASGVRVEEPPQLLRARPTACGLKFAEGIVVGPLV